MQRAQWTGPRTLLARAGMFPQTMTSQEQATRMADSKPDARARIRRSTRDGADGGAQRRLTSDRISADLADFQKAGGQVEVLDMTRVLKKLGESAGKSTDEEADQPAS